MKIFNYFLDELEGKWNYLAFTFKRDMAIEPEAVGYAYFS